MKSYKTIIISISIICLLAIVFSVVHAVPPLPSSFYGTVKVNGENIPEGTLITALIDEVPYGTTATMIHADTGNSVYALIVPGDDLSTAETIEGGTQGDTIIFKIGDLEAQQTGIWQSGTNINLNLSVGSAEPSDYQIYLPLILH